MNRRHHTIPEPKTKITLQIIIKAGFPLHYKGRMRARSAKLMIIIGYEEAEQLMPLCSFTVNAIVRHMQWKTRLIALAEVFTILATVKNRFLQMLNAVTKTTAMASPSERHKILLTA